MQQARAIVVFVGLGAVRPPRTSRMRHSLPIEPALGWTYLSREPLARAKAQMDEESMGVRDEIGFLTIHQRYADRFFPGTSVLHTRIRYAVFVPWLFEDLAGLTGPAAMRALRERERELAGRLKDAGESQVIGSLPQAVEPAAVHGVLECARDLGNIALAPGWTDRFSRAGASLAEGRGRGLR
jgi:Family of unknown function (DUF6361)